MQHDRAPVRDQHQDSPTSGSHCRNNREANRDRRDQKKNKTTHHAVTFVNVTEPGNDAEQDRHRIAGFRFGGLGCFERPIAIRAMRRVLRQQRPAIWTRFRVPTDLLRLSRRVGVFHLKNYRDSIVISAGDFVKHDEL